MANLPEIARLLAALAAAAARPGHGDASERSEVVASATISLAASLNLPHSHPKTSVLDAALSLMCFTAPEVWSWNVKCLVDTIAVALSSSISCKVVHFKGEDGKVNPRLLVGGSIMYEDFDKLFETLLDFLPILKDAGLSLYHLLFDTVVKAAISAPRFKNVSPISILLYKASANSNQRLLGSKLKTFLPSEIYINSHVVPLRLCLWYLDQIVLKTDILNILREYTLRPFLQLKLELHDRQDWQDIVRSLVASPIMFSETRTLLHNWFLRTGLSSVLDLQSALIASISDALSRPMWWNFSMDVGVRLPFSYAYFPSIDGELLQILNGSVSFKSFLDLVHYVQLIFSNGGNDLTTENKSIESVNSKSIWSMLINFPQWIYFAIMLSFFKRDGIISPAFESLYHQTLCLKSENNVEIDHAAAIYLSVILVPFDQIHRSEFLHHLKKLSGLHPAQGRPRAFQDHPQIENKTFIHSKRLRKLRPFTSKKSGISSVAYSSGDIRHWLQQFHLCFSSFCKGDVFSCPETGRQSLSNILPCQFITKIPLGILLSNPNNVDEEGCHLLLHYAATGSIFQDEETQAVAASLLISKDFDIGVVDPGEVALWFCGASLIFDLFDTIEDMITALFDTETAQVDYICQLKGRAVEYFIKCVVNISEAQCCKDTENDMIVLIDLHRRLRQWKLQGGGSFQGCKHLDDAIDDLSTKISIK